MNIVIASSTIIGKRLDDEPIEIRIEVGTPYRVNEDDEEWACPVAIRPLYAQLHDIHGEDSLQALCLAIKFIKLLLTTFRESGGVFIDEEGNDFPLDTALFGRSVNDGL